MPEWVKWLNVLLTVIGLAALTFLSVVLLRDPAGKHIGVLGPVLCSLSWGSFVWWAFTISRRKR
jgi:hypothetical protein